MRTILPLAIGLLAAGMLAAAGPPLPLPEAPVRLVIPDAAAFDKALTGDFRRFLSGAPREEDPLATAWRRSRVGSKLEDQWSRLAPDLPWTWEEIRKLQPGALGLAILQVGNLEAVLVVDTPLAQLPLALPKGQALTEGGAAFTLVTPGAADGSKDKDRRMGLAWARLGTRLILATSERALRLSLQQAQGGRGLAAPLEGLVSMELDLDALAKDRYFKREFLYPGAVGAGRVRAALRAEGDHLVEVRRGTGGPRGGAFIFQASSAASGWEPDGTGFWAAFRRGLLEPLPEPQDRPVPALASLPDPGAGQDRYTVDLTKPLPGAGGPQGEEGDLAPWRELLARTPVAGWGFRVAADGTRTLAIPWPEARDADFLEHCRATVARRAGRASVVGDGPSREIQVGPGLPALALRRAGPVLWVGPSARSLQDAPVPRADEALVRWAFLDLQAARGEGARWARAEGPAQPERVRPFSDQVLGLLGWMPKVRSLSVERRRIPEGWEERVVFGTGAP
jgi:hypothetical protein